jgi:hypothetical protein
VNPSHDKIESTLARLAQRVSTSELAFESIAPHEQIALLAYSTHNVVINGGFKQFYEGTLPLSQLVSALRALKLNALANTALSSAAQFPEAALADDPVARREHLASMNTDKQDYAFFRLSSAELLDAIAAFWKSSRQVTS